MMTLAMPAIATMPSASFSAAAQRAARFASGQVVMVCGGRDYLDRDRVLAAMDLAHVKRPITLVVHGACCESKTLGLLSADRWADRWPAERGVRVERHPANWKAFGKAAGPMRNREMAKTGAHGCIAFPGARGTANIMRCAKAAGIAVWCPYGI